MPFDLSTEEGRRKNAAKSAKHRQRNPDYHAKYNASRQKALNRLSKKYPKAYRRILNEERAAVGLPPLED